MYQPQGEVVIERRRSKSRVAYLASTLPADLAEGLWRDPHALVSQGEPLRHTDARRTVLLSWDSQQYVLKHYQEATRRHAAKQLFCNSRAWNTWTTTQRLADAGVATPRALACVENRWGIFRRDSFYMYRYIEGYTLRSCLHAGKAHSPTNLEYVWRQLSDLWRRLALLRASLADTNAGNFIIGRNGQLWVIDLDKARFHRLAFAAERQQQRGWQQLLRSVKKV